MDNFIVCKNCNKKIRKTGHNQFFCNKQCYREDLDKNEIKKKRQIDYRRDFKSLTNRYNAKKIKMDCLCCENSFLSNGKFNRICNKCKSEERFSNGVEEYGK